MEDYLDDREQWERLLAWLREQGPWMLGTVVVVLAAFGGWRYWQARTTQRDLAAGARYEQVLEDFSRGDFKTGLAGVDQLLAAYPSTPYAEQAELAAARVAVGDNQLPQAAERLTHVLGSTRDPGLKLLTRLRLARVQLAEGKPDQALATLNAVSPGAFSARYAEARGDALVAKGDRAGALRAYQEARAGADTLDSALLELKIDDLARS